MKWVIHGAVLRVGYVGERAGKKCETAAKFMGGNVLACVVPFLLVSIVIYRQAVVKLEEFSQEFASLYTCQMESSLKILVE
ncbi:hypothetical protein [Paenibacillus polymyxa]|uniref:hypothetical protein n=1 Tax=Paenibacillus polymyxa TaxID=1406 RepID=UPI00202548FD|nr:hypothetical protein [Paenibacillus polymyxa]URJ58069.1 hypothetical protein MF622_002569 [Paenibacillus polymyxa]